MATRTKGFASRRGELFGQDGCRIELTKPALFMMHLLQEERSSNLQTSSLFASSTYSQYSSGAEYLRVPVPHYFFLLSSRTLMNIAG